MSTVSAILKTVTCFDPCSKVHPTVKGVDPVYFPIVEIGRDYDVIEVVEKNGNQYYKFNGFPDNHLFNVRGFRDKNTKTNDLNE